ncbi:MAG: hypothetical protein Q4G40_00705 [Brachybacterium sp.]|nr:hypothetical protein [Brachybacterium sp.]
MIFRPRNYARDAERELKGLFAPDAVLQDAVAWGRGVLVQAGVDPAAVTVHSIAALRRADRRLSLVAARRLADLIREAEGTASGTHR